MYKINTDKKTLKKFALTMFIALTLIATFLLIKHKNGYLWLYSAGILFLFAGIFTVNLLKPVYTGWMKLAFILSWFNTRLILFLMFYLIFTPIGFIMRLFGMDQLERKLEKQKVSYWVKKEKKTNYERQF